MRLLIRVGSLIIVILLIVIFYQPLTSVTLLELEQESWDDIHLDKLLLSQSNTSKYVACRLPNKLKSFMSHRYQIVQKKQQQNPLLVFIAVNLYNSQQILPNMMRELFLLTDILGKGNVFISIYENGSKDQTKHLLAQFEQALSRAQIPHRIVMEAKETEYSNTQDHKKAINRIVKLAAIRNRPLEPMFGQVKYDRLLFLNDGF